MMGKEASGKTMTWGNAGRSFLLPVDGQFESETSGLFVGAGTEQTDLTEFGRMVTDVLNLVFRLSNLGKAEPCNQSQDPDLERGTGGKACY